MEAVDLLAFITAISVAICATPPAAGLFDLTSNLALSPSQYMTTQKTGVAFSGATITAALLLTLIYALQVRGNATAFPFSLAACLCLAVAELMLWLFAYPVSATTRHWTVAPRPFDPARKQWEYANAVIAVSTFCALVAVLLSIAAVDPVRAS